LLEILEKKHLIIRIENNMKVFNTKRKKNSFISYNRTSIFRDTIVTFGKRKGHSVFLSFFNNSYKTYEIISVPISNGTYKIKIISVDNLNNENTGVEGNILVDFYPLPPKDLAGSVSGNNVTLTWNHSINGAPDNYKIYGNNGTGGRINKNTSIQTISGSLLTTTFTVTNGEWSFIVESYKNGKESDSFFIIKLTVPYTNVLPYDPGVPGNGSFAVTGLMLENISVGKIKISFYWFYGDNANKFRVYHDDGTGIIDYNTYKFEFDRQNKIVQTFTTSQLHYLDQDITYKFAVRSVNSYNKESKNTNEYEISVDGVAPNNVVDLILDTVS
jgi:hypothetical protein